MSEKKFTVVSVAQKPDSKVWRATLQTEEGQKFEVKHWANAPFAEGLKLEAVSVAEFEKKDVLNGTPGADGVAPQETWLKRWGAAAPVRGGGKQWQPRPESETLSIMAQTALKEAVSATSGDEDVEGHEITSRARVFFDAMVEMVRSAKGKLGG